MRRTMDELKLGEEGRGVVEWGGLTGECAREWALERNPQHRWKHRDRDDHREKGGEAEEQDEGRERDRERKNETCFEEQLRAGCSATCLSRIGTLSFPSFSVTQRRRRTHWRDPELSFAEP